MGPVALLTHCPRGRGPSEGGWSRARGSSEGPKGLQVQKVPGFPLGPPVGSGPASRS